MNKQMLLEIVHKMKPVDLSLYYPKGRRLLFGNRRYHREYYRQIAARSARRR